jgi:hypothetical protein
MAIPCESCGKPVHETAVDCPHCGDPTGVPVDPIAEHEIELMDEVTPPPSQNLDPLPFMHDKHHVVIDPITHAIANGVAKIADAVRDDDDEPVPRAIARERPKK